MESRVKNPIKFEFILGTFKKVLAGSPSVFSFLTTNALADKDFLVRFFESELTLEGGIGVMEVLPEELCFAGVPAGDDDLLPNTIPLEWEQGSGLHELLRTAGGSQVLLPS
jgi:hypothetical protein